MRLAASILGVFVLLVNLACVALCAAPVAQPPCHKQHEAPKVCDQQTFADASAKVMLPAVEAAPLFALPVQRVAVEIATPAHPPRLASPPLILRI